MQEWMKSRMNQWSICLILSASALIITARCSSEFAHWYSMHIYQGVVNVIGRVMGMIPISVSESLLYLLIFAALYQFVRRIFGTYKRRNGGKSVFFLMSVLYFLYVVNCGVNYQRESFAENIGLEIPSYTVEDLKAVCRKLTKKVNETANQVSRGEAGTMILPEEIDRQAVETMEAQGKVYEVLSGCYPKPKGLLFPWILSIQNLTGVYSPFTVEANYNTEMPAYNIPFTACHELSHLRGFMQEEEANFIAYLASSQSDYKEFQYSGSLMGWIYCMNVLYQVEYDSWETIRAELSPQAEADLEANSKFWGKYDTKVAEVANQVNDTYLKANGQSDGVKSYDRGVDLIVAYEMQKGGLTPITGN